MSAPTYSSGPNASRSSKYFGWLSTSNEEKHKYELVEEDEDVEAGLMDSMTSTLKGGWESAQGMYEDYTISTTTWMQFFGLLATGCFFLFLASISLTMFAPVKFAQLFTLGSVFILASFVVLRGYERFYNHATSSTTNKNIACTYLLSLALTFYFTICSTSWFMVIVLVSIQIISLIYFLFSYIPGGKQFLDYIFGGCIRACCPSWAPVQ